MKIIGIEKIHNQETKHEIEKMVNAAKELYGTDEFAVVPNPAGIYPHFDIYPLAVTTKKSLNHISAVLTDMDGTTTTTEELCLHSQEFMIQKITSENGSPKIKQLDKEKDYPHIIGNSTTKHVEYLIKTYGNSIIPTSLIKEFVFAALWTLIYSQDAGRKADVTNNLKILAIEKDLVSKVAEIKNNKPNNDMLISEAEKFVNAHTIKEPADFGLIVRLAIDVYYQRYHEILLQMLDGKGEQLSQELTHGKKLIEPMPGIALFLTLIKGWLGKEAANLQNELTPYSNNELEKLGLFFEKHPVKIGLVTSSIYFEANIVLTEVCNVIRKQINNWNISDTKKKFLVEQFSDYNNVYDAVVTATDSHEIRLKPHRDLYSIALYKLGIPNNEFENALGFEDSESGSIAIRAAGVARSVGVPFVATKGHNLKAAFEIMPGGIPEIISKNLYLDL